MAFRFFKGSFVRLIPLYVKLLISWYCLHNLVNIWQSFSHVFYISFINYMYEWVIFSIKIKAYFSILLVWRCKSNWDVTWSKVISKLYVITCLVKYCLPSMIYRHCNIMLFFAWRHHVKCVPTICLKINSKWWLFLRQSDSQWCNALY